jgi:hypothetical protein
MKATIETISPRGYKVSFESHDCDRLAALLEAVELAETYLAQHGYGFTGEFPKTPEGAPICPIHGVPMRKREKQGDTWWSHRLGNGNEFCRGYGQPRQENGE